MTREEAIKELETIKMCEVDTVRQVQALDVALSALRPVSRERVEWMRGEWQMVSNGKGICSECHRQDGIDPLAKFCRYCGAPMTDEAVDIELRRWKEAVE